MVGEFEAEQPTNPDTNRSKVALLDVYDVAQKAVDLGLENRTELVAMRGELKTHLARERLPAMAMWTIAIALWGVVFVLVFIAVDPHAAAASIPR